MLICLPMNKHLPPPTVSEALAGMTGRRWTVAEIEAMTRKGIIREKERFELLHGEIRLMSPKGNHHEPLMAALNLYFARTLPANVMFIQETTFRLTANSFVEPDFLFYPKGVLYKEIKPSSVLLVGEVSDTSLSYDIGRKAALYAMFGIPELWVFNAAKLVTHVFREPAEGGYLEKKIVPAGGKLALPYAPRRILRLSKLERL